MSVVMVMWNIMLLCSASRQIAIARVVNNIMIILLNRIHEQIE